MVHSAGAGPLVGVVRDVVHSGRREGHRVCAAAAAAAYTDMYSPIAATLTAALMRGSSHARARAHAQFCTLWGCGS